jgi:beta-phosphoglucomutase
MSVSGLITTVIFDFDGVLADTERLHLRAFQQLGYDDEGLVAAFDKDEHLGLPQAVLDALVAEKGEVFAGYLEAGDVLFPGAIACVENLAKHFTLGIASGALKTEITNILGAANLLAYFPVIVSAEDVDECKPAPEPYLTAARRLGVRPGVCVAIEDSPPGLQAARTAGMKTVGVTTTAARHLLSADLVIDRLDQFTPELVVSLARRLPG